MMTPDARSEWRSGWRLTLGASVGLATGIALHVMLAGLFIKPLQAEFGWSRSEIAGISIFLFGSSLLLPFYGRLADRVGARTVGGVGLAGWGGGLLALSCMTGSLAMYYAISAVAIIAGMAASVVVFSRPVVGHFEVGRGAALGLTIGGVSLLSILAYPVAEAVIQHLGWRGGYRALGAVSLLMGLPVVMIFLPGRRPAAVARETMRVEPGRAHRGASASEAVREPRFWLLAAAMLLGNLPVGGITNQLHPLLTDVGVSAAKAAVLGSLFAASIAVGRLAGGAMLDRFAPVRVVSLCLTAPIIGVLLIIFGEPNMATVAIAVICFGVGQGAEADFVAFFAARYFGIRSYGAIYGVLILIVGLGQSAGSFLFGLGHDLSGNYTAVLLASALVLVLAIVTMNVCDAVSRRMGVARWAMS